MAEEKTPLKWKFKTEDYVSSPILNEGILYFGSDDSFLYALDIKTGKEKWKVEVGSYNSVKSPISSQSTVYFGASDYFLYALDSDTGKEKWKFETGGNINSSPFHSNGILYFGSEDCHLYALDSKTGKEKWKFEAEGYIDRSSPAIANGILYFGCSNNDFLYALDSETGKEKWKFETKDCISSSSPIVVEGVIYFGSADCYLYALDSETGEEKWKFEAEGNIETSPLISDGIIYFGSQDNHIYAVNINIANELAPIKKEEELRNKELEIQMIDEADKNGIIEENIKTQYISGEITLERAIELQSQHNKEEKLKLKWKEEAKNNIIRVNCEQTADLDTMLLLRGCLVLVLDPDNGWAYGNHIKSQGGGTFAEHHIIMKYTLDDDGSPNWGIAVGPWFGHNCSQDELVETASGLDGFDKIKAEVMFDVVYEVWSRFVEYGSDENSDYESAYLCQKNVIPDTNDDEVWYAEDNFDQDDNMSTIDIESVSESVPGNMVFIS